MDIILFFLNLIMLSVILVIEVSSIEEYERLSAIKTHLDNCEHYKYADELVRGYHLEKTYSTYENNKLRESLVQRREAILNKKKK